MSGVFSAVYRAVLVTALAASAAAAANAQAGVANAQSSVTISVNGERVQFDQPPIERAGRIYVPLRGVFERLGATVVYQDGHINATRGSTTISLAIGNAAATLNGQTQHLDSPPFESGARTLVPLRFVAQALGAIVSYDGAANAVSIVQQMPDEVITPVPRQPAPPAIAPRPPAPPLIAPRPPSLVVLPLVRTQPANGTAIVGLRPSISAGFSQAILPDASSVRLDGRDVTGVTYVSASDIRFDPPFDLPYGTHRMQIFGRLADGRRFTSQWAFGNRATTPVQNYLRALQPPNGTRVGRTFTVRGLTQSGSFVQLTATATLRLPNGSGETYTLNGTTRANAAGAFGQALTIGDRATDVISVRITSRAPNGTPPATALLQLRSF